MSFLKRIKNQMNDPRTGNYRHKERVLINGCDLRELVDNFERLDSDMRSAHPTPSINERLSNAIEAIFHQNKKDGEITLLVIMETLKPLVEARHKEKLIERII